MSEELQCDSQSDDARFEVQGGFSGRATKDSRLAGLMDGKAGGYCFTSLTCIPQSEILIPQTLEKRKRLLDGLYPQNYAPAPYHSLSYLIILLQPIIPPISNHHLLI